MTIPGNLPKNKVCFRESYVKYHNTWNVRMFAGQWHSLHVHLSPSCVAHHVVRQALVTWPLGSGRCSYESLHHWNNSGQERRGGSRVSGGKEWRGWGPQRRCRRKNKEGNVRSCDDSNDWCGLTTGLIYVLCVSYYAFMLRIVISFHPSGPLHTCGMCSSMHSNLLNPLQPPSSVTLANFGY